MVNCIESHTIKPLKLCEVPPCVIERKLEEYTYSISYWQVDMF